MSTKDKVVAKIDTTTSLLNSTVVGKALLDGGLSMIPWIGASISSALNARAFQLFEKNTRVFAEEIGSELNRLTEEKIDKSFVESDEFVSILLDTLTRNARVYEREKTRLFARAFVNFSSKEYSRTTHKEGFIEIIDRLSVDHARAIAFIYKKSCEPESADERRKIVSAVQVAGELGQKQSHVEAWCEQLSRFGIIKDARLATYQYAPGEYEITNYGRELAGFIGEVDGR